MREDIQWRKKMVVRWLWSWGDSLKEAVRRLPKTCCIKMSMLMGYGEGKHDDMMKDLLCQQQYEVFKANYDRKSNQQAFR